MNTHTPAQAHGTIFSIEHMQGQNKLWTLQWEKNHFFLELFDSIYELVPLLFRNYILLYWVTKTVNIFFTYFWSSGDLQKENANASTNLNENQNLNPVSDRTSKGRNCVAVWI